MVRRGFLRRHGFGAGHDKHHRQPDSCVAKAIRRSGKQLSRNAVAPWPNLLRALHQDAAHPAVFALECSLEGLRALRRRQSGDEMVEKGRHANILSTIRDSMASLASRSRGALLMSTVFW